ERLVGALRGRRFEQCRGATFGRGELPLDLGARLDRLAVARAERFDDALEAFDGEVFVGVVADHDHRGVDAGAKALGFFPAQLAVRRNFERIVRDLVPADVQEIAGAAQHARGRAANDDVGIAADGLQQELRVEGRDFEDADIGHAQHRGDGLDGGPGDPALLLLRAPQDGDHGRLLPAGRVARDDLFRPRLIFGRESEAGGLNGLIGETANRHQRSTSPKTISSEPRIADTSASMWPRVMKSIALRWAKPGALILQRYGRLVPSETR